MQEEMTDFRTKYRTINSNECHCEPQVPFLRRDNLEKYKIFLEKDLGISASHKTLIMT
jgi:hypothetical protein